MNRFYELQLLTRRSTIGLFSMLAFLLAFSQEDIHVPVDLTQTTQCLSEVHRAEIRQVIAKNRRLKDAKKRSTEDLYLEWPVSQGANFDYNHAIGISNYLDQNTAYPDQLLDYNCGQRTYDLSGGYNHAGIDIFSWPFQWKMQANNHMEIVAAAPGTIIYKYESSYDKNCSSSSDSWNAVYVEHDDGSVAWYGHMQQNSLTNKAIGERVEIGEFLGMMGSSGFSTGSHLHFELYDANDNLIDPYDGPCNSTTDRSWWVQQPDYNVPHINQIYTHRSPPTIGCHDVESLGVDNNFQSGEQIIFARYFRDQTVGTTSTQTVLDPFGQVWTTWSSTANTQYTASYWYNTYTLPSSGGEGEWTYRVEYNGETIDQKFYVHSGALSSSIDLSTSELSIEDVTLGFEGSASFDIINTGAHGVFIESIDYPDGFSGGWYGFINAGMTKTIQVTYRPELAGTSEGTITINTTAQGTNQLFVSGSTATEGSGGNETCDQAVVANLGTNTSPGAPKWFQFTAPSADEYLISSLGLTGEDTYLNIYSSCMTDTGVSYENDDYLSLQSAIVVSLDQGEEIKILWSDEYDDGAFDWSINQAPFPAGLLCETAVQAVAGQNTVPPTGYNHFLFKYTMQGTNKLVVSSGVTNEVYIIEPDCYDPDDFADGEGNATATALEAGDEVMIAWVTQGGGDFTWNLQEVPLGPGDNCDLAVEASLGSNSSPDAEHWFMFTAPATDYYDISSVGTTTVDTSVEIYSSCVSETAVYESDYFYDPVLDEYFDQGRVTMEIAQSETIYIYWDAGTNTAGFNWNISTLPVGPGDVCDMAVQATNEDNEIPSTLRKEYWFKYTMPVAGWLDVSSNGWWYGVYDIEFFSDCSGEQLNSCTNEFYNAGTEVLIRFLLDDYYGGFTWSPYVTPKSAGEVCELAIPATLGVNTVESLDAYNPVYYSFTMPTSGKIRITSSAVSETVGVTTECPACGHDDRSGFGNGSVAVPGYHQGEEVFISWQGEGIIYRQPFEWNIEIVAEETGDFCDSPIHASEGQVNVPETINYVLWYDYVMTQYTHGKVTVHNPSGAQIDIFTNNCSFTDDDHPGRDTRSLPGSQSIIDLGLNDRVRIKIYPDGGDFSFVINEDNHDFGETCEVPAVAGSGTNTVPRTNVYEFYNEHTMTQDGIFVLQWEEDEISPFVSINNCDEEVYHDEEDGVVLYSHPLYIDSGDGYYVIAASAGDKVIIGWETPYSWEEFFDDPADEGLSDEFDFSITVEDLTLTPDVTDLPDVIEQCQVDALTAPTATDELTNSHVAKAYYANHTAEVSFPIIASTTIRWVYTDGIGNVTSQLQEVIIEDTIAPEPEIATLNPVVEQCIVNTLVPPVAVDNCDGTLSATHDAELPLDMSTTITWTYTDLTGNVTTQDQEIIIADTEGPTPDSETLQNVVAQCEVTQFLEPTATDNCNGSVTVTHNAQLPMTDQGAFTVTWTYTDIHGNTTNQDQTVIIDDTTPPTPDIQNLQPIVADCVVDQLVSTPTASDNCGGAVTVTNDAQLPIKASTDITWTYVDSEGNSSSQVQAVIIMDTEAPATVPSILPDIHSDCSIESLDEPTTVDNCEVELVRNNAIFPITGSTTVFWTLSDPAGNVAVIPQNIIISDQTAPEPDLQVLPDISSECALDGLTPPTATDNCGGAVTVTSDAVFPITSSTTVTWTYSDGNQNTAMQTQSITIADISAPVLDFPNLDAVTAQCQVDNLSPPTATDNCDGAILGVTGASFPITQNTTITWTYTDSEGNSVSQDQDVVIEDTEGPTPDSQSLQDVTAECRVEALTAPTATDNCGGSVTVTNNVSLPITSTTTITWTYTDEDGNTTNQDQNVIIDDITDPVPDAASLSDITTQCSVSTLTAPTAQDNCAGVLTATHDVTLPIETQGTTVVTWTFDDGKNMVTQSQNVIIDDTEDPVPNESTLADVTAECEVTTLTAPTASDNCAGSITASHNASLPIEDQGTTVVTWTYDDGNGNTVTQTQNVVLNGDCTPLSAKSEALEDVSIYPNPVRSNATLETQGQFKNARITLRDLSGKVVWSISEVNASIVSIPMITLDQGLYFVTVHDGREMRLIKLSKK